MYFYGYRSRLYWIGKKAAYLKCAKEDYEKASRQKDFSEPIELEIQHAIENVRYQKRVYDTLFEQMSREELLARQIEANTKIITQQVKRDDIIISYKMLLEAGILPENARQSIMRNYCIKEEELYTILH